MLNFCTHLFKTFRGENLVLCLRLMRWHNPSGILLLFWPCAWGLILSHNEDWFWWLVFFSGSIVARTASVVYNDWVDRHIDVHVRRTQQRPLATKQLPEHFAFLILFILTGISCFYFSLFSLRVQTLLLVTALGISLYPFMKRWIFCPQIYLGILFNMGLWIASLIFDGFAPYIYPEYWFMYLGGVCWTVWYDTLYALQDASEDKILGLGSLARFIKQKYFDLFHLVMIIMILGFWWLVGFYLFLPIGYTWGLIVLGLVWFVSIFVWPGTRVQSRLIWLFWLHAAFSGLWITHCLRTYVV